MGNPPIASSRASSGLRAVSRRRGLREGILPDIAEVLKVPVELLHSSSKQDEDPWRSGAALGSGRQKSKRRLSSSYQEGWADGRYHFGKSSFLSAGYSHPLDDRAESGRLRGASFCPCARKLWERGLKGQSGEAALSKIWSTTTNSAFGMRIGLASPRREIVDLEGCPNSFRVCRTKGKELEPRWAGLPMGNL